MRQQMTRTARSTWISWIWATIVGCNSGRGETVHDNTLLDSIKITISGIWTVLIPCSTPSAIQLIIQHLAFPLWTATENSARAPRIDWKRMERSSFFIISTFYFIFFFSYRQQSASFCVVVLFRSVFAGSLARHQIDVAASMASAANTHSLHIIFSAPANRIFRDSRHSIAGTWAECDEMPWDTFRVNVSDAV